MNPIACFLPRWLHLLLTLLMLPCQAEVTLDGSLGGSAESLQGPDYAIQAGMGVQTGSNLFHSFGDFNLNAAESATFNDVGSTGIVENILSRVTGGRPSNINGRISTDFANDQPNLFFINPAGVVFGSNASLDIQGSFHVSTSNYLKLGDHGVFHADLNERTTLSMVPVTAFGFTDAPVGNITLDQSRLLVPAEETLSVIGGNIDYVGGGRDTNSNPNSFLFAGGGRINLASVASSGEVLSSQDNLDMANFAQLGDIQLSNAATISTNGDGGGRVAVHGGTFSLNNALLNASNLSGSTEDAQGIDIDLTGSLLLENGALIQSAVFNNANGKAGNLIVDAEQVNVRSGGLISVNTFGQGAGGDLAITTDSLQLNGDGSSNFTGLTAQTHGTGNAGSLTIKSNQIEVRNGAEVSTGTFSQGEGGDLVITTDSLLLDRDDLSGFTGITAQTQGFGNAGNLAIHVKQIEINNGTIISTDTFGKGHAGRIDLIADKIALSSDGQLGGIFAESKNPNSGDAGSITIKGSNLNMTGSVQIGTSTFSEEGKGGRLDIDLTGNVTIIDNPQDNTETGLFSITNNSGQGGNLMLQTLGNVALDGGRILTRTRGNADAGSLTVKSENLQIINGGQIFSGIGNQGTIPVGFQEGKGNGGDINITVMDTLFVTGQDSRGFNSGIFSNAQIGQGHAGIINVSAALVDMNESGLIRSSTFDAGNGGNITIAANEIELQDDAQISATSESPLPNAGNIDLNVTKLLRLNNSSAITTTAAIVDDTGTGNGGNININTNINSKDTQPTFLILDDGSQIIAQAQKGSGGNININTDTLFRSPNSIIDASSQFGQSGTVTIDSPDTNVIEGALILPGSFLDASALLSQRCAARGGKRTSSFIIKPLEGIQPTPDDYLSAFYSDTITATSDISQQKPINNIFPDSAARDSPGFLSLGCAWY